MIHCDGTGVTPQILENSPAHHAGLEAYFDFVISIDGVRLVGVVASICCVSHNLYIYILQRKPIANFLLIQSP